MGETDDFEWDERKDGLHAETHGPRLNPSGQSPTIAVVAGFEMALGGDDWPFLNDRADDVAHCWAAESAANPALFDGRVLVASTLAVENGIVRGRYLEVPFSALLYWRRLGFPSAGAFNCFGAAVACSRDGAVLLGVMAPHTANAGRIYFPCGTPDPGDIDGTRLDIERSILRELEEETGLGADVVQPTSRRWLVRDDPIVCCARRIDVDLEATALETRVRAHLAADPHPELSDIIVARRRSDLDGLPVMAFTRALLSELLPG
jgi:8-oxo-dGTP pyrophosphatase MutT (NUDIX family)